MKLTKIAIALVAVLAMSAVVASGASANPLQSNAKNVILIAEDNGSHTFTVDGQKVVCNKAVFESGELAIPANTISPVNAVYNTCTAFGFAGATVNMGNCHYDFTTPNHINANEHTSEVMIVCTGNTGNTINVNSSVFGSECSVSIGQNATNEHLAHVVIDNTTNNAPKDLTLTIKVTSGIQVTKNKDNGLCPLSGTGTVNNGTYNRGANGIERVDMNLG
jgi:hypothetical protein